MELLIIQAPLLRVQYVMSYAEPSGYAMTVSAEVVCLVIAHQQIQKLPPLQKRKLHPLVRRFNSICPACQGACEV